MRWIVLLNPDAFPEPDWLECLVAAAERHSEFSFFGCRMLLADTPELLDGTGDVHHVSGMCWRRDYRVPTALGVAEADEIFGPCAAAALYSRRALDEVGGFDEAYFCYHEDVDLAFRLRLRGHRCRYVPEAVVRHVSSGIAGVRSDFATYHGERNLVWTYFKDTPAVLFWSYLPMRCNWRTSLVSSPAQRAGGRRRCAGQTGRAAWAPPRAPAAAGRAGPAQRVDPRPAVGDVAGIAFAARAWPPEDCLRVAHGALLNLAGHGAPLAAALFAAPALIEAWAPSDSGSSRWRGRWWATSACSTSGSGVR